MPAVDNRQPVTFRLRLIHGNETFSIRRVCDDFLNGVSVGKRRHSYHKIIHAKSAWARALDQCMPSDRVSHFLSREDQPTYFNPVADKSCPLDADLNGGNPTGVNRSSGNSIPDGAWRDAAPRKRRRRPSFVKCRPRTSRIESLHLHQCSTTYTRISWSFARTRPRIYDTKHALRIRISQLNKVTIG